MKEHAKTLLLILVLVVFFLIIYFVFPAKSEGAEFLSIEEAREQGRVDGVYVSRGDLINSFGEYNHDAFKKHSVIVKKTRKVKPDFTPKQMSTSFYNRFLILRDGREIVFLSGCKKHDCVGNRKIIAFEVKAKKAYLLEENLIDGILLFGYPDKELRAALLNHYFQF